MKVSGKNQLTTIWTLLSKVRYEEISQKKSMQINDYINGVEEKLLEESQNNTLVDTLKQAISEIRTYLSDLWPSFTTPKIDLPVIKKYLLKDLVGKYNVADCTRCIIKLSKEQLEDCQLIARNNILYFKDGINPVDSIKFGQENSYNYVLSHDGHFFARNAVKNFFHHSSFLGGDPVACSGEITIRNGKVIGINNRSGHYKPTSIHLMQAVVTLYHMGVISPECEVTLYNIKTFNAYNFLTKLSKLNKLPKTNEEVESLLLME